MSGKARKGKGEEQCMIGTVLCRFWVVRYIIGEEQWGIGDVRYGFGEVRWMIWVEQYKSWEGEWTGWQEKCAV